MDPNAPVPQGDDTNQVPPSLEERQDIIPPPVNQTQEPQNVQTPPAEPLVPTQPFVQPPSPEAVQEPMPESITPQPPVDQPPPSASSKNPVPPEVGSKSSPIFTIALVLLLVAIVGLGGYFLYTKYLGNLTKETPVETSTIAPFIPTIVPEEMPESSSTSAIESSQSASVSPIPSSSPSATPLTY